MSYYLKDNSKEILRDMKNYMRREWRADLKAGFETALQIVANISAEKYWIQTKSLMEAGTFPVDPKRLTVRSGRLLGSIVMARRFSKSKVVPEVSDYSQIPTNRTGFEKGVNESIRIVSINGNKITATIGTTVDYAEKHEYGTARMKRRPFLNPAAKDAIEPIEEMLEVMAKNSMQKMELFSTKMAKLI